MDERAGSNNNPPFAIRLQRMGHPILVVAGLLVVAEFDLVFDVVIDLVGVEREQGQMLEA